MKKRLFLLARAEEDFGLHSSGGSRKERLEEIGEGWEGREKPSQLVRELLRVQ